MTKTAERYGRIRTCLVGTRYAVGKGLITLRSICHTHGLSLDVSTEGGWWNHAALVAIEGKESDIWVVVAWLEATTGQTVRLR